MLGSRRNSETQFFRDSRILGLTAVKSAGSFEKRELPEADKRDFKQRSFTVAVFHAAVLYRGSTYPHHVG